MKKRNLIAKALSNQCFRIKIVKSKKGKGSYVRKVAIKGDLSSICL